MERDNLLDCHGMRFRATIYDTECEGVITVENDKVYLCQNEVDGVRCDYLHGYKYSWVVGNGSADARTFDSVSNFILLKEPKGNTIEDIQTAIDLLKSNGYKVLKQDWIEQ